MNEFVTWQTLGTYAGAVMMVTLITQFLKQLQTFGKVNSQLLSYFVAVLLLIGSSFFTGSLTFESGVLSAVNAVMVSLAANGTYDAATTGMIKHTDAAILDAEGKGEA